ncbi:MAG: DUF445 family protein, partial [Candidatus Sericytochromatia bacterium]|nr:DUF445 family protein [Candidatus Sericytochromatia bacterium]
MVVNQLILNLISGGLVGYTTNLLAVKMLSKKYPIFGGDIISKNSDELKNNLNNILENRLKNNQEINNIFENSEFKSSFNELIGQGFESFINNENNQIKILNLPDSALLIKNISDFISKIDLFESIDLNVFLNQLKIKDLLGNEQTSIFANKFYNLIMKVINPEIKSFLIEIYSGLKDKRIDELVEKDILNKLLNNFELIFNDIRPKLASIDGDITLFIQESLAKIDINIILESLEKNIKAKKIIEIIGSENKENLTKELVQHFIVFIDSDEGLDFLNKLAESLINLTKGIDSSLLDFLSPVLKVKIFEFIKKNIPYLADTAKDWLRINKKEIEVIIENTIDQYYSSQNSTLSQIKLRIKDLIGLKVSEYFKIVEKGIEQFEDYIDNSASEDLTEEIIGFLNNKQLGNLFSELNLNKDVLATFFHQMIHQYLPKINTSIFDSFFEKKLEDITGIFKVSFKEKFGDDIKLFLAKQIKYQIFYSSEINDQLQSIVKEKLENIKNDSFSSLLSVEKFDSYVSYLPIFLMFSQSKIVDKLIEEIKRQAENKSLSDIINQDIQEKIKPKITSLYGDNIEKLALKIKEIKLSSIYQKTLNSENVINLADLILINNQDQVKIKIIGIIKSVINNINIEKFKNINKKLLVENTLPITMIGTVIGSLSGITIYFNQSFNVIGKYYNTPTNQLNLFISLPVTYAVIGMATNW